MAGGAATERLRTLLDGLEQARARLEHAEDAERAVDALQEIADLAKQAQAEVERLRREAAAGAP